MEGKTSVEITFDDKQYNEFKKGQTGYIDGYVRGGNDVPYAAVVLDDTGSIVLVPTHSLKAK